MVECVAEGKSITPSLVLVEEELVDFCAGSFVFCGGQRVCTASHQVAAHQVHAPLLKVQTAPPLFAFRTKNMECENSQTEKSPPPGPHDLWHDGFLACPGKPQEGCPNASNGAGEAIGGEGHHIGRDGRCLLSGALAGIPFPSRPAAAPHVQLDMVSPNQGFLLGGQVRRTPEGVPRQRRAFELFPSLNAEFFNPILTPSPGVSRDQQS